MKKEANALLSQFEQSTRITFNDLKVLIKIYDDNKPRFGSKPKLKNDLASLKTKLIHEDRAFLTQDELENLLKSHDKKDLDKTGLQIYASLQTVYKQSTSPDHAQKKRGRG